MSIDRLLDQYERGRISRRGLMCALAAMVAAASGSAATADGAPIGKVTQMNHVSIFVPDVQKSKAVLPGRLRAAAPDQSGSRREPEHRLGLPRHLPGAQRAEGID